MRIIPFGPMSPLLAGVLLFAAAAPACFDHEPDEREVTAEVLHGGPVTAVAFSPDNLVLASASEDDTIRLLDVEDFQINFELPAATTKLMQELDSSPLLGLGTGFRALAFAPDSASVAAGNYRFAEGGVIKIWDVGTGERLHDLVRHDGPVIALDYGPDGELLASGAGHPDTAGEAMLWGAVEGVPLLDLEQPGHGPVNGLAFAPDGSLVAGACEDGAVRIWRAEDGELVFALVAEDHTPRAVDFSPDGLEVASVGDDSGMGFHGHGGLVRIWNVEQGELAATLDLESSPLRAVAYSHDGSLIAAAGDGHRVFLVDPWSGVLVDTLDGHAGPVNSLDFSDNGQLLASAGDDFYVRLWHVGDLVGATCNDAIDNDGDGWIDADDPDCEDGDRELGHGDSECNDGWDNDDDAYTDADDPDCTDGFDDTEHAPIDGGAPDSGTEDAGPEDAGPEDGGPDGGE